MSESGNLDPATKLQVDELFATLDQDTQDKIICDCWDYLLEHEPAEAIAMINEIRQQYGTEVIEEDFERGKQLYKSAHSLKRCRRNVHAKEIQKGE